MSINLRADNRTILKDAKFSYLLDNYSSSTGTVYIANTEGFFANSYVLLGNIGSENTEILQIRKVNPNTGAITFKNFTDTIVGEGLYTVTLNNPGSGYMAGQILDVVQLNAVGGKIRVASVAPGTGAITSITIDSIGYRYSNAVGVATTGGGDNLATINITAVTTAPTGTTIYFSTAHSFIANQPVEVFDGLTGASRGTGTVSAPSDPTSTTMTLTAPGIVGVHSGDIIVVGDVTKFAHSESSKMSVIQFNSVRFFRTDTPSVPNTVAITSWNQNQDKSITQTTTSIIDNPNTAIYTQADDPSYVTNVDFTPPITFTGAVPLTGILPLQVNDFFTTFFDTINSTGYGWFAFYNETTLGYSPISNAIPYSGFPQNTVKNVFETFDSSMNTKELKLITQTDRFNWLNEGLSYMVNELNLGNWEYYASEELTLTVNSGIAKYLLPQDFSDLLFVTDAHGDKMESYAATFERPQNASIMRYAIRGKFIIFYPVPEENTSVTLAYLKSSTLLTKLDDVVDLPNNAFYAIKDYMRFRAYQKLANSGEANNSFAFFNKQIENMKIHAIKRDDGLDSWSIAENANV